MKVFSRLWLPIEMPFFFYLILFDISNWFAAPWSLYDSCKESGSQEGCWPEWLSRSHQHWTVWMPICVSYSSPCHGRKANEVDLGVTRPCQGTIPDVQILTISFLFMSNLILTIETFKSDELDFENLVQMLSTIVSPQSCIVVSFLKSHILAR